MLKARRLSGAKANMKRCVVALGSFMGVQPHTRQPQGPWSNRLSRGRDDSRRCKDSTAVV
eukprot:501209-Amphidinium_carterae.1